MLVEACPECGRPLLAALRADGERQLLEDSAKCPECGAELCKERQTACFALATDPGLLNLSGRKLRTLRPELCGAFRWLREGARLASTQRRYLAEQLLQGDTRAAIVVCERPLTVAAYADELDCVALLKFSDAIRKLYTLSFGDRLLAVNSYKREPQYDLDLLPGPARRNRWTGIHPLIADFLSDDLERIEQRKREIADHEWQRTADLGESYLKIKPGVARDGRPIYSATPAGEETGAQ